MFVFDTRRGKKEGEELDKLLAFFPRTASAEQQQARFVLSPPRVKHCSNCVDICRLRLAWRRR